MKTFSIQVLGCKVNQYEGEQIATLLRQRGLVAAGDGEPADLRIVHTCSVTAEAGKKSAQTIRRMTRLPVLQPVRAGDSSFDPAIDPPADIRTIVTGCWATSHPTAAGAIAGVDAVIGNKQNLNARLAELLDEWSAATNHTPDIAGSSSQFVASTRGVNLAGATSLPLLADRQSANQRAFLKIQDGCDAYCTYCIIPQLRPTLWSKPAADCIAEAQSLVDAGHVELILTGIFLGAYGHATALRRRQQPQEAGSFSPGFIDGSLAHLINELCKKVKGLRRLRLSSLEPGDLDANLIAVLKSHEQTVPHFHLPLQSGSDVILKRMNRQYRRDDFLRMIDDVNAAFDRPAITTDIIVGFPGETDDEFAQTLDIARRARFIHTHAFSYSARPRTAAARWTNDFIHPTIANERIKQLTVLAAEASEGFRRQFVGEEAEVLVERAKPNDEQRHGRCERYFDVHFTPRAEVRTGQAVKVRIENVTATITVGTMVDG